MLINIEKFLIINIDSFNKIIQSIGVNLTIDDPCYMATYILTNIFGYLLIFLCIKIIMFMYYQLFSKKKVF